MAYIWVMLKRLALLLLGLAGLGAATVAAARTAPEQTEPRPAIWLIEDADTKIYLFGTVHAFPASLRWRSAALNRVIAEADELVMETPEAGPGGAANAEAFLAPMRLGKTVPILSRVSPAARPALQATIASTGLPIDVYDQLTTWGAAFLIAGFQITQTYADNGVPVPMSGAEEVLSQIFRKSRRPISGVETIGDQLRVFSTMPLSAQQLFLESTVTGVTPGGATAGGGPAGGATAAGADASGEIAAGEAGTTDVAWLRGDVDAIGREMLEMAPEIYEPLLTRRNRNWTGWLEQRMRRPGIVLFAVGAGHLAGPQSVQTMLAARGIAARRIH